MKRKLILALLLAAFVPLLNICCGTSASAQSWAYEGGSLWGQADETREYHIERCEYCKEFICGKSKDELERNMKHHLFSCNAYLLYLDANKNNDYGNSSEGNNSNNSNDNSNSDNGDSGTNVPRGIKVVDLSQAALIIQQLGMDCQWEVIEKYERSSKTNYISYPYVSLNDFLSFVQWQYKAKYAEMHNSYSYPFIGLYANDYAIIRNGKYLVIYNISTAYRKDYDYVLEF